MKLTGERKIRGDVVALETILKCSCGSPNHWLEISRWDDDEDYIVAMVYRDECFWDRIKNIFRYLFRNKRLYAYEICLDKEDIQGLVNNLTPSM